MRLPLGEHCFEGKIDVQGTAEGLDDDKARENSEFIEHLTDDGQNTGLIVIAPHGGNIEQHTDEQAQYVYEQLFFHLPIVFLHGSAKVLIKKKTVAPLTVGTLLQLISARNHSQSLRQFIGATLSMPLPSMDLVMKNIQSPFALEE